LKIKGAYLTMALQLNGLAKGLLNLYDCAFQILHNFQEF